MRIGEIASAPTRAVLLATAAALSCAVPSAQARVGVTSATDGDPLGRPPAGTERVLRIGIDVQANEVITTQANDRAHLMFLDGTSLTVGPNAQLTIDRFAYDPDRKTGELAISAGKGVLRLVGGKISKNTPVVIKTPASAIGIRGGITILSVEPSRTTSTFVFGHGMTVTAAGQTQTVTRPGSQVTTSAGAAPGAPQAVGQGVLGAQLGQLEGRSESSSSGTSAGAPAAGAATGAAGKETAGGNADQMAQSSGFSGSNSSQAPAAVQTPAGSTASSGSAAKTANSGVVSGVLTSVGTEQNRQTLAEQAKKVVQPPATPPTTVLVTRGRYFGQAPISTFDNQTLAASFRADAHTALAGAGSVTGAHATIALSDGRAFTVPWQPGAGLAAISVTHPTYGVLTGSGYVSASGDFFAYQFTDSSSRKLGFLGGTPTALGQFPTSGVAVHTLVNVGGFEGGQVPFANTLGGTDTAVASGAGAVSPLYSIYSPNIAAVPGAATPGPQRANALQATISISGTGASQTSYMGVFIGDYFKDYNNNSIFAAGSYEASYRTGATAPVGRLTSAVSTIDTGSGNAIYGPNAEAMVFSTARLSTTVASAGGAVSSSSTLRTAQAGFDQPYTNLSGSPYFTVNTALRTSTPSGLGQTRTTQTMNGYTGGVLEQIDSAGTPSTRAFGPAYAQPTDLVLSTDAATNRVRAEITVAQWDVTGQGRVIAMLGLGGLAGDTWGSSSFIDDKVYALRSRPAGSSTVDTGRVSAGSAPSRGAVDATAFTSVMASSGATGLPAVFQQSGVTPCTCDFLTWGWWSTEYQYQSGFWYNPGGRDRINLATYVAGTITPALSLPSTGTATYSGHVIGSVVNGPNAYIAAGSYSNVWNFATQTGAVTIGNFDGATYTGNTALSGGTANFTGALSGAGRTGAIAGSFFSSPTVPAKGQAGSFSVTGTNYKAGGTFAAQKP